MENKCVSQMCFSGLCSMSDQCSIKLTQNENFQANSASHILFKITGKFKYKLDLESKGKINWYNGCQKCSSLVFENPDES